MGFLMAQQVDAQRRAPLSRERVLRAAVALADEVGIDAVSMRKLAQELGVVPMALYKHVANKDELLDGMVDVVVAEIDSPTDGLDWKSAVRRRILAARRVLLAHPWASHAIESRRTPTPIVLAYLDSMIGMFRTGGFSIDLTHHVMHVMGSRMLGFTQELFDDTRDDSSDVDSPDADSPDAGPSDTGSSDADLDAQAVMQRDLAERYPYVTELAAAIAHDEESVVGSGCDDQFEFEFALDLLLDGFERLRQRE